MNIEPNLELTETKKLLEFASKVVEDDSDVQTILSDRQKEHVKKILRRTCEVSGDKLTESQLDKATDLYFASRFEFEPPKKGVSNTLSHLYVMRNWIATRIGIPVVALATISYGAMIAGKAAISARQTRLEKSIEESVETEYKRVSELYSDLERAFNPPQDLPNNERDVIKTQVEEGRRILGSTSGFFERYCPGGVSDEAVTLTNFKEVDKKLSETRSSIGKAVVELENGKQLVRNQERLVAMRSSLESNINQIRAVNPAKVLAERAEDIYAVGISSIVSRQLQEAEQKSNELMRLKSGIESFGKNSRKIEGIYKYINSVAIEEDARSQNNNLYKSAQVLIQTGDFERLDTLANQLSELEIVINQDYRIELVNREGVKTGVWRYPNDNPNDESARTFYLIVEAVTKSGERLELPIKNEENGQVNKVNLWAERVPEYIFERVKQDKIDNGVVDNSSARRGIENRYFAEKNKGYLSVKQLITDDNGIPLPREGQITQW